jgi:hypothetical protein
MTVFVIIPQPNPNASRLPGAIKAAFPGPDAVYDLDEGKGWLVSSTGTAQSVSEKLGITTGENGGALVIEMASYFGRANPNIWSWIRSSLEKPVNG